jgi:signal peptidase I
MFGDPPSRDQSKQNLAVEVLRKTGNLRLAAFGNSMLPALFPGDILTIKAEAMAEIRAGDVVLFGRQGRFFIHRVLRRHQKESEAMLLTRGDAMPHSDQPVSAGELLGRIVSLQRGTHPAVAVPACSIFRRTVGLLLAYSGGLRSLVLRWHQRRLDGAAPQTGYASGDALPR